MYEIILEAEAHRTYERADAPLARKLNRCWDILAANPYSHPNIKRLAGRFRGLWRYRVGDWRVVYIANEATKQVVVLDIIHRSEAYR